MKKLKYFIPILLMALLIGAILICTNLSKNKKIEIANITTNENIPVENILDSEYIGKLIIPSIELEVGIKEGTKQDTLKQAVGHFTNTNLWEGNVGLAGHNRGFTYNYFENLYKLRQGDEIIYITNFGERRYIVETIEEISSTDWSILEQTEDNRITLITCIKNKPNLRLVVQAKEIKKGSEN